MKSHVRILGILHIVYGFLLFSIITMLSLVIGVAAHFAGHSYMPFAHAYALGPELVLRHIPLWALTFLAPLMIGIPGIIGGIGLLLKRSWARIVIMIIGLLCLLDFPLGTALGAYTLWVLLQPQTKEVLTA